MIDEGTSGESLLHRYFRLLDSRLIDELLDLFAPDGGMITRGGTDGSFVSGRDDLRRFYEARGPAAATHKIVNEAAGDFVSFAEGLVWPHDETAPKFFIASAILSAAGLIERYTTLVWPELNDDHVAALLPESSGNSCW